MTGSLSRLEHTGGAPPTKLSADITSSDSHFSLLDATNYPTGARAAFVLCLDPGLVNEEKVLCDTRVGASITTQGGSTGRGYDGTTPSVHGAGAVVTHVFTAGEADDNNAHLYDTDRDDHSNAGANSYMRTDGTRHDLTTRHLIGTSLPSPSTPSTSAVGDIAGTGASTAPARSDHAHARETFGTGESTAIPPNTSAANGSSVHPARADHTHSRSTNETFGTATATSFSGPLTGNVTGNVTGAVTGNTSGTHTGAVVGNVTGNVTGNLTGNVTGFIGDLVYTDLSPTGAWTNIGGVNSNLGYRLCNGEVFLRGAIHSGTVPSQAATVPSRALPLKTKTLIAAGNGTVAIITITAAGVLTVSAGDNTSISFDGLRYDVV